MHPAIQRFLTSRFTYLSVPARHPAKRAVKLLEEFAVLAQSSRLSLQHLAMYDIYGQQCDCDPQETDAGLIWSHRHHGQLNRVMWEIIKSCPGLLERLRSEIQTDIASPDRQIGDQVFGEELDKEYARALAENFLTETPNENWVTKETRM